MAVTICCSAASLNFLFLPRSRLRSQVLSMIPTTAAAHPMPTPAPAPADNVCEEGASSCDVTDGVTVAAAVLEAVNGSESVALTRIDALFAVQYVAFAMDDRVKG